MKMTKIIAMIIITGGFIVCGKGLWQLMDGKQQEEQTIEIAKKTGKQKWKKSSR